MNKGLNTKIKDKKAITLIALVITIVVLIILATVTINLTIGNNGIFQRAKNAKEQYQNAEEYEQSEVASIVNRIDSTTNLSILDSTRDPEPVQLNPIYKGKFVNSDNTKSNKNSVTVPVTGLEIGKRYIFVCYRAYTGGQNAYGRTDTACYTCTFSDQEVTSATLLSSDQNNYIVIPKSETVNVVFGVFQVSQYNYGAQANITVIEI